MNFLKSFFLTVCFTVSVSAFPAQELPFKTTPAKSRKIEIGKQAKLVLEPGNFEIVAGKNTSPAAKFAAEEIADALSKVFQTKIQVVSQASGKKTEIRPGDWALANSLGIKAEELDRDGFVIKTAGNKILIVGRDDFKQDPRKSTKGFGDKGEWATLFGAYDFLERFAGVRYYFPGDLGTVIPQKKTISLPEINIYDRPDFLERRFNDYDHNKKPSRPYPGWNTQLNWLRNRAETIYIPNCHGIAYLGYNFRFGKSHPEYFALNTSNKRMLLPASKDPFGEQICFSSKIRDEIAADAVSFLKNEPASVRGVLNINGKPGWNHIHKPGMPCFNIMPNDCAYLCRCAECQKHFSKGPQEVSNYIWDFFNDIARKVKAQGGKGFLTTMAYADYRPIPTQKIEDNILVMLAIRGPWNEYIPSLRDHDVELLKKWNQKLGSKTWLWTYPGKYFGHMPGIPHTTPRSIGSFIKRVHPYIFGLYIENESDFVMFNYLNYYVFGKVSWNPETDVDALLNEHARDLFGPAAVPMKEFFDSVERNWAKLASNVVETSAGPKTIYPSELILWTEIYSPEELKRLNSLFDQAEKLAAKNKLCLARIKLIRQQMLGPVLTEAKKFAEINSAVNAWNFYVPEGHLPVRVDGSLSDEAWKKAKPFYLFGLNGTPAEVKTSVKILYDKDYFYFGIECEEPYTGKMAVVPRKYDAKDIWKDSDVEIFLSPDGDREHYYQLQVNAKGSFCDLEVTKGGANFAWNSKATVKTAMLSGKKWTAEIALPRSSMRTASPKGVLADFARHRALDGIKIITPYYCWNPFAKKFGDVTRFGMIKFTEDYRKNLIDNPDFDGVIAADRWLRRPGYSSKQERRWWSPKKFNRDVQYFLTGGGSARLDGTNEDTPQPSSSAIQYLDKLLKPNTEYEFSFFARMDQVKMLSPKNSGFYVRIDTGDRKSVSFPSYPVQLSGTCPWTRFSFRFRTGPNPASVSKAYVAFSLRKSTGSVWIDRVEMYEVK